MSTQRDKLIEENLDLPKRVTHRLARKIPHYGMLGDVLESEAFYLLVLAAERYDRKRNIPFRRWAVWFIRRRLQEIMRRKFLADCTHDQLSEEWDGRSSEDSPESKAAKHELKVRIAEAIAELTPRSARIVSLYYNGELSYQGLGPHVGLKGTRVGQIHRQALSELKEKLGEVADYS